MKQTINEAKKAVNYFINQGMIEEMTTDKRYYTQSLIDYIIKLENELIELDKKAKTKKKPCRKRGCSIVPRGRPLYCSKHRP